VLLVLTQQIHIGRIWNELSQISFMDEKQSSVRQTLAADNLLKLALVAPVWPV